ncbi:DNA-directed RNA polymerase subunit alpha [Patescibacteria group bacterium]|nr:DNA-directed RNA polymerase subunit alpha [Patescibacteria group bacterium]MBU1890879.1 DNA-directed RNA polymerase subunit alpha [Patescibacteria group bacterium]
MESISLPKKIEIIKHEDNNATFVIEPCYPGYGTTLGNAMRRVLLSSLEGAAITSVKIANVSHEFSTLPFVKEDIVEIILNLKTVRLKLHGDGPVTLKLKQKGEKRVTASDIKATSDVEVASPDVLIATLTDKKAEFEMDIVVEKGRGYVPIEMREKEKNEIAMIAIDAIYTPVKNVNFEVESVRVGQMTNYDRLKIDVVTDGTLSPEEAFHQSANILHEQFGYFLENVNKPEKKSAKSKDESDDEPKKKRGRPKKSEAKEKTKESEE